MKSGKIIFASVFLLIFSFLYSDNTERFFEAQDYEPAYFFETSIISDDAKLIYWKDGVIYYKDIFNKKAKWKKLTIFKPDDFFMRIEKQKKINLLPVTSIRNLFFYKNKSLCAFTTGLGTTPNTTVLIVDKNKNNIVFTPVLKEIENKKHAYQIFMERVWFGPVISEDEKYLVCDGYNCDGYRISALFDIGKKALIKEFTDCAYPFIYKNMIYYLKEDRKNKGIFLSVYDLLNDRETQSQKITGRVVGLKVVKDTGLIITDKNIIEFDINNIEKCKNVIDFASYFNKFQNFTVEQAYACIFKDKPYLFVVIKGFKDKYEWKLYCYKV